MTFVTRRQFTGGAFAAMTDAAFPHLDAEGPKSAVVFNVEKFATHDGPGIRTVVFLKGCPLRCMWCHSPESWNPKVEHYPDGTTVGRLMTTDEVLREVVADRDFYESSGGGMTLSGGEPLFHCEFTEEIFSKAKAAGISTAIETSGYAPLPVVKKVAAVTDLWLFDIKGMDADRHRRHTKVDNVAILRNLRWLDEHGAMVVLRCPMIPGVNDLADELEALARLANDLKCVAEIDVEPYIPYGIDKAHKLGLTVYEAPQPPPEYGPSIVARLSRLTAKRVRLP